MAILQSSRQSLVSGYGAQDLPADDDDNNKLSGASPLLRNCDEPKAGNRVATEEQAAYAA